jgi:ubiquinone/menaquinone biosynthesis C-methylase UbiE
MILKRNNMFRFYFVLTLVWSSLLIADGRDDWQQPEKIMESVGIKEGMVIGEAGVGSGYFNFKLLKRVGESGTIYANDIDDDVLEEMAEKCSERGIRNIKTIKGEIEDPLFPTNELDMIIMMMAFHDFTKPTKWLGNAEKSLKPGAPLVIIDRDPDKYGGRHNHFYTKEKMQEAVAKSNFKLVKIETFLERDNIYVFKLSQK